VNKELIAELERVGRFQDMDPPTANLLLEAAAALRAQEWRPIETAPKVYSPPLSYYNHHAPEILGLYGESFYCLCSWGGPNKPVWIDKNDQPIPFQPTRWMHLPTPPETCDDR
jgi:hypothetical protein